ncbi:MAG: hypothetical protein AAF530_24220 [Pseudomonadota bacterium]
MNPIIPAIVALVAKLIPQGLDLVELVRALSESAEIPQADRDAMKTRIKKVADLDWN